MASEFAEARAKTITEDLIDEIIGGLVAGKGHPKDQARQWWKGHKEELIGLSIAEFMAITRNIQNKKDLVARYDELVSSMNWPERIEFLKLGVEQMRRSNRKKIRQAYILGRLVELTPKVLSVILAVA